MTHAVTPLMQQMNDTMGGMREAMKGEMSREDQTKMSRMMDDMSKDLSDLNQAMDCGKISDKQIQTMEGRLAKMQTTLNSMQHNTAHAGSRF